MKNCEMCGANIPDGVNACMNCGGIISEEDFGVDRLIGNPDWGKIVINLTSYDGNLFEILAKIRNYWLVLENGSAQKLFDGQLNQLNASATILELYGPRESFVSLASLLAEEGISKSSIDFNSMPYEEIYKLRDGFPLS